MVIEAPVSLNVSWPWVRTIVEGEESRSKAIVLGLDAESAWATADRGVPVLVPSAGLVTAQRSTVIGDPPAPRVQASNLDVAGERPSVAAASRIPDESS